MAISDVRFARAGEGWIGHRVLDGGHPQTVLFLPTLASNVDVVWEPSPMRQFWERVGRFANVIFFDRRGTGVSDGVPGRIAPTLDDWADDALAVMSAVGVDRVTLVAQALGVAPAILFAAGRPDRVGSMVLIQGFARLTNAPGYDIGVPDSASLPQRIVASVEKSWGEGASFFEVHPHLIDDPVLREWIPRLERASLGRATAARAYRTWLSIDVRDVVASVQAPTLVMQTINRLSPVGAGRWLAENLQHAELFERAFPSLDWWILEGQDEAVAELERFLTGTVSHPTIDERVLATVLFTDIIDSTRIASRVGDREWHRRLDDHDRIASTLIQFQRGRVVKSTGDGVMAVFDAPSRGVECAVELLKALNSAGLTSRAGLHTGEVEVRGEDVSGIAVHLAARITALAQANEVLVSRTIPDLVAGSGTEFDDRGTHELKGVPGNWQLMAVHTTHTQ